MRMQPLFYPVLAFLLFLISPHGFGQSMQSDSLKQVIEKLPENRERVDALNDLNAIIVYDRPESTIEYAEEAVRIAQKIGYAEGLALALNRLGSGYWSKGFLQDAFNYYTQSLEKAHALQDAFLIGQNLLSVGNIYAVMRNREAAVSYYREALPYFLDEMKYDRVAVIYNNLGKVYFDSKMYDSALFHLDHSLPMAEHHIVRLVPILLFNQAETLFFLQQYDSSYRALEQCLQRAEAINDMRAKIRGNQLMAEIALKDSLLERADTLSKFALQMAKNTDVKELLAITYDSRAKVMNALNQNDSAYLYQRQAKAYQDSLWDKDTESRIDFFEYTRKQQAIESLRQENKTRRLEVSILLGVAFTALLVILFSYRYHRLKVKANRVLKKQNQAIYQQAEELTALNATKDKFFSIIAHDVRSPINQLVALSGIILKEIEADKSTKEVEPYAQMLATASGRAQALVEDLLTWARTQSGKIPYNPAYFSINELITNNIALQESRAEQKYITLQTDLSKDYQVFADRPMVDAVLRNLLDNAIKFTAQGSVSISVEAYGQEQVKVTVADTGQGIQNEYLSKLFRVDSNHSTKGTLGEKGTGLGLVLCKEFIERQGGTIWVESEFDKGSKFIFTLPTISK